MLLEAMDKKLAGHKHYTSRQLSPMDKELKHKEEFRIRYALSQLTLEVQFVLNHYSLIFSSDTSRDRIRKKSLN